MGLETAKPERLDTPEAIALYLQQSLSKDDPRLFIAALGDVARAQGMTRIAAQNRPPSREPLPFAPRRQKRPVQHRHEGS